MQERVVCLFSMLKWPGIFGWPELSLPRSSELARIPFSRTKPLDLSLFFKTKGAKKRKQVCNQYSDILITNRIRGVTKGFEQDNEFTA